LLRKFLEPKFCVNLDCEPKFHFGASHKASIFPYLWQNLLHPASLIQLTRQDISSFRLNKFLDRGATDSAAHGFEFGTLANLQAPTASFTTQYSNNAAYQTYLKRVFGVTSNQGLLQQGDIEGRNHINSSQTGLKSRSLEPMRAPMNWTLCYISDDAAYQ